MININTLINISNINNYLLVYNINILVISKRKNYFFKINKIIITRVLKIIRIIIIIKIILIIR